MRNVVRAIARHTNILLGALLLVIGVIALIVWLQQQSGGYDVGGSVPMTTPTATTRPSASVPVVPSSSSPATRPTTTRPTSRPPVMKDIDGVPIHITITQGGKTLADADIVPIQLDATNELNPPVMKSGWYGPPDWNTVPGNLSSWSGVIVGHNATGSPLRKDVFYDLGMVKKSAKITLQYRMSSGSLVNAEFTASEAAHEVLKADLESLSKYWGSKTAKPGRKLMVVSCVLDAPHVEGHSIKNYVVRATRTK